MFSLLIDSEIAYLNVHWRRTDPLTMDVSYEMTLIEQFFISKAKDMTCLRRMIWKMLGWARETRLNQIRNLIRQSHRAVPLKKDKPKQSARATSSQASSVRGSSRQSLTTNDR